jgi:dihydroorotate dehydrogenase electron transfer subunit
MNPENNGQGVFVEDAEILSHESHPGGQFILRVRAPRCAVHARPGSFAHIQCHPLQPMRRPLSIMRTSASALWVEFLYKVVGLGTQLLSQRLPGERISLIGPIGRTFERQQNRRRALLIGGGVGIPPMIFLAETLRGALGEIEPFVIMGSEVPFPFPTVVSTHRVPGIPANANRGLALLEEWGIASRLASLQGLPGSHRGSATGLARMWLDGLGMERAQVHVFACGPHPMLESAAELSTRYGLPCQIAMEELMACGVGGCAGCTIEFRTPTGPAMRRVCVDGPVFDAAQVFGEGNSYLKP